MSVLIGKEYMASSNDGVAFQLQDSPVPSPLTLAVADNSVGHRKQKFPFEDTIGNARKEPEESGTRKDREEWTEVTIATLIDAYTAKYSELNGKGLRGKDWEEVVNAVNKNNQKSTKTIEHCRNKMDTLTKRYKSERKNKLSGIESSWPWYFKMEVIRGCPPDQMGNAAAVHKEKTGRGAKKAKKIGPDSESNHKSLFEKDKQVPVATATSINAFAAAAAAAASMQQQQQQQQQHLNFGPQILKMDTASVAAAAAAAAATTKIASSCGGDTEEGSMARSIAEFASSLNVMAGNLASSITGFAEVFARIEMAKMEMLKDLELKRIQMQLDSQVKLAKILSCSREKRSSSDSE